MKFDVWLESGVSVRVPEGTDANTEAGLSVIREAAAESLRRMLERGQYDLVVEPFEADLD
jgi:hypothetical protein